MAGAIPKNSSISSFKKWPSALAISLVLFFSSALALEQTDFAWHFFYIYSRPATDHFLKKEAELRLLSADHDDERVFLVGSSLAYEGYDENYLNQKDPGKKFYNFGSGGVTPFELFLLRKKYIAKLPEVIVFPAYIGDFFDQHDYGSLKYFFRFEALPLLASYSGYEDLYKNRMTILDAIVGRVVPFYCYNRSIVRSVESALGGFVLGVSRTSSGEFKKTGAQPSEFFESLAANEKIFKKNADTELYKKTFLEFVRAIRAAGIRMIVVYAPLNPRIASISEPGLEKELDDFLSLESERNNFEYINRDLLPQFTGDEFVDFSHLNEKGRIKNSDFLWEYLADNPNLNK